MILKLKKRHFRNSIFMDGQRCPIANALKEEIGKRRPSWKLIEEDSIVFLENEYWFSIGIRTVSFKSPIAEIRIQHYPSHNLNTEGYMRKNYRFDKALSFFVGEETTIRTIEIKDLNIPELSDMTSSDLISSSPKEQKV